MGEICSDLVVVELGSGSAAASETGMFLADNGARVLKVEAPEGDLLRSTRPAGWLVWNRGKESVVADLSTAEGRATARTLVDGADVVIDGLHTGEAEAAGLGYDDLRESHPSLVYCSIKGFGPNGPYAAIKGYDALVAAKAGTLWRGDFSFRPGPIFTGGLIASNGAAHEAVAGILGALIVRDRTGVGQRVDASLYQGLNPIDYFVSYHVQIGRKPAPAPAAGAAAAPPRKVPAATRYMLQACTRDGRWIVFSPQQPHQAKAMIQALELDAMLDDERFKDMPAFWDLDHATAWESAIYERVKERDLSAWLERGLAYDDLPFEPMYSAEEAIDHPQLRANGNVITVDDPVHGPVQEIGPVANFSATPVVVRASAPALGEHGPMPAPVTVAPNGTPLPAHPLAGVTIVEFGYYYAMPFGVTLAAGLGARVIKVENLEGDPMRWSFGGPEWGATKTTEGKESICLDVRSDEGRKIMQELLRRADVFVQGFRPGVDKRLGVDIESVKALNPDIVYVHGAGYGSEGPMAHRPIYAGTAAAAAGSWHRHAAFWIDPELCAPMSAEETQAIVGDRMRNLTDGDANAAVNVFSGLLFGLRHRLRTGEGQFVGTSMVGGNAHAYADDFNRYEGKVPVKQSDPDQMGTEALYRLYEAADGTWVMVAAPSQAEWETLARAAGRTDLIDDARFRTAADRQANDDALIAELSTTFGTRVAAEWEADMLAAGAGCVAVTLVAQAQTMVDDENLRAMGLVGEVDHPKFGSVLRYAPSVGLSATPGRMAPGCTLAQHTASILSELGYSEDEIAKLAANGVVRLPD